MKCKIFIPAEHCSKVEAILEGSQIIPTYDNNGNISDMDYAGDSIGLSEVLVLKEIAPYIIGTGYIEDTDDYDDLPIRWAFHNGHCYELRPQVTWPEPWNGNDGSGTGTANGVVQQPKINAEQIKILKETYLPGVSIQLISMYKEPQMPPGLKGEVSFVDDIGQIHVAWQNGSSLALNIGVDKFIGITGPSAAEYLGEKLGLAEDTKTCYREDPSGFRPADVDNDCLISAAERYLDRVVARSQSLAIATGMLYETDTIFDTFLSEHILTDEDVRQLKQKREYTKDESEAGICPKCGGDILGYGTSELIDTYIEYPWKCNSCGSTGKEYGAIEFDGHYVDTSPDFES